MAINERYAEMDEGSEFTEPQNSPCPMCGGDSVMPLGTLGKSSKWRCRNCGWTFSL